MRRYWFIPLALFGLFVFFWTVNIDGAKKPFDSPKVAQNKLDLQGGPERTERGFPKREIVDLTALYPDIVFDRGSTEEKVVALTFDDGPDDLFTPQVLDVLKEKKVKATFFIMGKRAEALPKVTKRIVDEGHLLANHTWNHPNIAKISEKEMREEITMTEDLINKYVKEKDKKCEKLFRSPYGSITPEQVEIVGNMGYKVIAWNVDSLDWKGLSAAEVKTNILENVTNGSIILQHSAGGVGEDLSGTVEALPEVIDVLKEEGFKFVTIDELLERRKKVEEEEKIN